MVAELEHVDPNYYKWWHIHRVANVFMVFDAMNNNKIKPLDALEVE